MRKTVVILISDKRSGSTLFQRELLKHPDLNTLSYSPHTYLESHHWLKGAVMLNKKDGIEFGGNAVYKGYGPKANARKYMEDCILGNIPEYILPCNDKDLIFGGWEALCERYARPVFFEKSPQIVAHKSALSLMYDWYQNTDFRVKFVFLMRNPMSIMYSAYQLFYTDPESRQYGWLSLMNNMLEFASKIQQADKIWVKYEDLVDDPKNTFKVVQRFIGLSIKDDVGSEAHRGSKKKWVDDENFAFQFNDEIKEFIFKLGYSNEDIYNPAGKKPKLSHKTKTWFNRFIKLPLLRFNNTVLVPLRLKNGKI